MQPLPLTHNLLTPSLSSTKSTPYSPQPPHPHSPRYSLAAFSRASHDYELTTDGALHVHLDAAHMGVGGDDSWSPSVWEASRSWGGKWRGKRVLRKEHLSSKEERGYNKERQKQKGAAIHHHRQPAPYLRHRHHTQEYAVKPGKYGLALLLAPTQAGGAGDSAAERWLASRG